MAQPASRLAVAVACVVAAIASAAIALAPPRRSSRRPAATACAWADEPMTARWARVPGWIGGDGAISVPLGDGRVLWLFGDSLVAPGGAAAPRFVRNAAVVEDARGDLVPTTPTLAGAAFLAPPRRRTGRWMWPSGGVALGSSSVWLFATEMQRVGAGGQWGFRPLRSWILRMDRRTLNVRSATPVPDRSGIVWGVASVRAGRSLYVFGVDNHAHAKHAHLARTSAADPVRAWRFWDRRRWLRRVDRRAQVLTDVASQFSVVHARAGFVLITHDPWLKPAIEAYAAHSVLGPWRSLGALYRPPLPPGGYSYNAVAHPEAGGPGLLVSYSLARAESAPAGGWPEIGPPRFVRLRRACLAGNP